MEYIYSALLLHAAGKKIDEGSVSTVLRSAGIEVNEARVKALVSALEGINIDEAIKAPAVMAAPPAVQQARPEEKKEEKKPEEKKEEKKEEEALAGLGALFG